MLLVCHFQIADVKGILGLLMVIIQILIEILKILDVSYGTGTGNLWNK
jgi:carotenoid cleavage dioxygenase